MASHLAAQDYLARLQASGLNFQGLGGPTDPYSSLGIPSLGSLHKAAKNSKSKSNNSSSRDKNSLGINSSSPLGIHSHKGDGRSDSLGRIPNHSNNKVKILLS